MPDIAHFIVIYLFIVYARSVGFQMYYGQF